VKSGITATAVGSALLAAGVTVAVLGLSGGGGRVSSTAVPAAASSRHVHVIADRDDLRACEQRLASWWRADRGRVPALAILGASYTAGVGPNQAGSSWAVLLARYLRYDAVIYGVPGAGYVRPGSGDRGPLVRMLHRIRLAGLDPSVFVIQLGHDDMGIPPAVERRAVQHAITLIRSEDPDARIALVTVFTTRDGDTVSARRTDSAIVSAARSADRNVIIMDPLTGHWNFPHADGGTGLHPTAAGDEWIAHEVASELAVRGIRPVPSGSGPDGSASVVCDSGIPRRAV
jgi:lysophospholipase L1-like esterase